jgi:hypothetical protein
MSKIPIKTQNNLIEVINSENFNLLKLAKKCVDKLSKIIFFDIIDACFWVYGLYDFLTASFIKY